MAKYRGEDIDKLIENGHFRIAAKFSWDPSNPADNKKACDNFKMLKTHIPNGPIDHDKGYDVEQKLFQAYWLEGAGAFVIIGTCDSHHKKARWGLEMLCEKIIFGTNIRANFFHPVEAVELANVYPVDLADLIEVP